MLHNPLRREDNHLENYEKMMKMKTKWSKTWILRPSRCEFRLPADLRLLETEYRCSLQMENHLDRNKMPIPVELN